VEEGGEITSIVECIMNGTADHETTTVAAPNLTQPHQLGCFSAPSLR